MKYVCPNCGASYPQPEPCSADGVVPVLADDELLGETIGSYRVARLIGQGGMGKVYRAVHPGIGSRVAIKVLTDQRKSLVQRFFDEARAVNLIRSEQIVNILDLAWLPDGRPYIVMEYLDGISLGDLLRQRGPMPPEALFNVAGPILSALAAAHRSGIVHRDLKPDNVFVTAGGFVKVLDFGIAKLDPGLASPGGGTASDALIGTPRYMSPEQAQARPVDARSDLYSVGVILYQALTGNVPFAAPSLFELIRLIVEMAPPSPRALRPEISPALEAVVLRALEKDPARRFASADEMSKALFDAVRVPQGGAKSAGPAGASLAALPPDALPSYDARLPPALPRRPGPRWLLVAAIAFVVVGSSYAWTLVRGYSRPRAAARETPGNQAAPGPAAAPARSGPRQAEAKLGAYVRCLNQIAVNVYRDRDWYFSWVDRARGPTGRERFIRGVGGITFDPKACTQESAAAALEPPPLAEVENEGARFASASSLVFSLESEAGRYYQREDYKDDGMKKGAALHPRLVSAWEDFAQSERHLRELVTAESRRAHEAILSELENAPGQQTAYLARTMMRRAEALASLLDVPGRELLRIDVAKGSELALALERDVDALSRRAKAHPEEVSASLGRTAALDSVLEAALRVHGTSLKILRRVRARKAFTASELQDLSSAFDSPRQLVEDYNWLLGRAAEELRYSALELVPR